MYSEDVAAIDNLIPKRKHAGVRLISKIWRQYKRNLFVGLDVGLRTCAGMPT
jgi:hypothetical protein